MTWFRVDDGFPEHPKLEDLEKEPRAYMAAITVWTIMGADCARRLTDGFVSRARLEKVLCKLGKSALEGAAALVSCGLWHEVDGGWSYHDWHDYQPTKQSVAESRKQKADRQRRWRNARVDASTQESTGQSTDASRDAAPARVSRPSPSQPVPSHSPLPPSGASASAGQEVREGWAAAWFAAGAGTPPVLSGQTFAAAVEFARQVAKTHGKPLHETAKAIGEHVLRHSKQARDIPFDLARVDPFVAPRTETAEEHAKRANHVGESYEDYLKRKKADPWAKAVRP